MIFRQFLNANTGCASYVVGCCGQGRAAVVDPQCEVAEYVDTASRYGMKIEAVINTHIHADHRSGARRLAEAVSAPTLRCGEAHGRTDDSGANLIGIRLQHPDRRLEIELELLTDEPRLGCLSTVEGGDDGGRAPGGAQRCCPARLLPVQPRMHETRFVHAAGQGGQPQSNPRYQVVNDLRHRQAVGAVQGGECCFPVDRASGGGGLSHGGTPFAVILPQAVSLVKVRVA